MLLRRNSHLLTADTTRKARDTDKTQSALHCLSCRELSIRTAPTARRFSCQLVGLVWANSPAKFMLLAGLTSLSPSQHGARTWDLADLERCRWVRG